MYITDFLIKVTDKNLKFQNKDGSFPAGHNGPYFHEETPVRNSSHWLITLSKCYEITGDKVYKSKIQSIAEYLCSDTARPYYYSFYNRIKNTRDRCNGLVGQAWVFEALAKASIALNNTKYALLARSVFLQHLFNQERCLWSNLEIDGRQTGINWNFNQQLWFAATSAMVNTVNNDEEIKRTIIEFIKKITENSIVLPEGLIYQYMSNMQREKPKTEAPGSSHDLYGLKRYLKKIKPQSIRRKILYLLDDRNKKYTIYRSIGYHSFNLCALGILKAIFPENDIWKSGFINKTTDYILSKKYEEITSSNRFGFGYNIIGFEIPYAVYMLADYNINKLNEICSHWVNSQINKCFNKNTFMMDRNTDDPATLTARIYEITRLPDELLNSIKLNL